MGESASIDAGSGPRSWWNRLFQRAPAHEGHITLKLRVTRFRDLLEFYGAMRGLAEDAAEKQGGGFVLDRQYVVALVEQAAEIAEAAVFDLNVLTEKGSLPLYETAERLAAELRALLAPEPPREEPAPREEAGPPAVSPTVLAEALERAPVLFRETGQVACRGAAAGTVYNLAQDGAVEDMPEGSVLVAEDLGRNRSARAASRRPAAILLDRGGASGPAARLARELRIPAILGLSGATSRLRGGTEVTVDADENAVYLGRVQELLDYAQAERLLEEEDREYTLLRSVRRAAFPLTFGPDGPALSASACRTLHDVVHIAQSFAGDAVGRLLVTACREGGAAVDLGTARGHTLLVINLGEPLAGSRSSPVSLSAVSSRPLRALMEGLCEAPSEASPGSRPGLPLALHAVCTEERALVAVPCGAGLDLLDFTSAGAPGASRVYCRFAPRGEKDPRVARGVFVASVLSRLGVEATPTQSDVCGLTRGLAFPETEGWGRLLGRLLAHLARLETGGVEGLDADEAASAFLEGTA